MDLVATPTRAWRVPRRQRKPDRIVWGMLTRERFSQVQVLREVQYRERRAGTDVRLREDLEEGVPPMASLAAQEEEEEQRGKGRKRERKGKNKASAQAEAVNDGGQAAVVNGHGGAEGDVPKNFAANAREAQGRGAKEPAKNSRKERRDRQRQQKRREEEGAKKENREAQEKVGGAEVTQRKQEEQQPQQEQQKQKRQQRKQQPEHVKTVFVGRIPRTCRARDLVLLQ